MGAADIAGINDPVRAAPQANDPRCGAQQLRGCPATGRNDPEIHLRAERAPLFALDIEIRGIGDLGAVGGQGIAAHRRRRVGEGLDPAGGDFDGAKDHPPRIGRAEAEQQMPAVAGEKHLAGRENLRDGLHQAAGLRVDDAHLAGRAADVGELLAVGRPRGVVVEPGPRRQAPHDPTCPGHPPDGALKGERDGLPVRRDFRGQGSERPSGAGGRLRARCRGKRRLSGGKGQAEDRDADEPEKDGRA